MKSFLKCLALILCFTFIFALLPADVSAANMTIEDKQYDGRIYKGGTFDVEIKAKNAIDPNYQWQYSTDKKSWNDIFNGESRYGEFIGAYKTHLQLVTTTDMDFDPMKEFLFLRCKVTASNGTVVKYTRTFQVGIDELSQLRSDLCVYSLGLSSGNWIKGFNGTNLTYENESEYFPVICSTEAGCPMTFYVNLQQLDEKFTNSEVDLRVAIVATENGKSITRNGGASEFSSKNKPFNYTPYTVSPGNYASLTLKVTVSPYINGVKVKENASDTRLDHTWDFNIIGKAPKAMGKANVNYACTLKKGQYNESENLTSFIKNEEVDLIKQVGSWWQVMANGYVGYLPVTAVTVQGNEPELPTVDEIRISALLTEPKVNEPCTTDIVVNGGVEVTNAYWWWDQDGNGAADEEPAEVFKEGGDYYLRIELKPQEGYRFPVTWEPGKHGGTNYYTGTVYINGEKYTERIGCKSDGSGMVIQLWEKPALSADVYTVTFDANGGSVALTTITTGAGGELASLPIPTHSDATKEFAGWYTDKTSGIKVAAPLTVTSNVTLYAHWNDIAPTTYTVTFDGNGGSGTMASVSDVNGEYTLPACAFTAPAGKEFKAWNVNGTEKAAGDKITVTENITITAVWKDKEVVPTTYTVTFNANGGKVTPATATTGADGKLASLPTPTHTDSNKVFDGWYTTKTGTTKVTTATVFTANTTIYAHWKDKAPAPITNPFTDVKAGDYFFDPVMWAVKEGITAGTSATTFEPNTACTRAHAVTFLWRAAGEPAPKSATHPFTDVVKGSYYEKAVLWAAEKGITAGTSATTFSPDDPCTRGQIVTFLWRFENKPAVSGSHPFTDVPKGFYYEQPVIWAVKEGITNGTSATTIEPDAKCTRGQIVTFLYRDIVN
ncbi:MAG: InlB B-repeat-containing protein [Firmicutes bacterium]|nr:InlB B-repeat-containing protein [Bacillota bacterium]